MAGHNNRPLEKLLANLGYGSRRAIADAIRDGRVAPLEADTPYDALRFDGQPLDPPPGSVIMLNKPEGYSCTTEDPGRTVYDLLPERFRLRRPVMACAGRLDKETRGLVILTDDGALLHRIISPKSVVGKVYEVTLASALRGDEQASFASGTLMLRSEKTPLLPVDFEQTGPLTARVTLREGRYHQVRRMFAALGNRVHELQRTQIGSLTLGDLAEGSWRLLGAEDIDRIFEVKS